MNINITVTILLLKLIVMMVVFRKKIIILRSIFILVELTSLVWPKWQI